MLTKHISVTNQNGFGCRVKNIDLILSSIRSMVKNKNVITLFVVTFVFKFQYSEPKLTSVFNK